jgi:hypothetical protein
MNNQPGVTRECSSKCFYVVLRWYIRVCLTYADPHPRRCIAWEGIREFLRTENVRDEIVLWRLGAVIWIIIKQIITLQLGSPVTLPGRCITVTCLSKSDYVGQITGLRMNWNGREGRVCGIVMERPKRTTEHFCWSSPLPGYVSNSVPLEARVHSLDQYIY